MKRIKVKYLLAAVLLLMQILLAGCLTGDSGSTPKYIFLFIGDGMGAAQATLLGDYRGTVENDFTGTQETPTPDNPPAAQMPNFMDFPVIGNVTTYDASKFITDSAAAGTAIACGVKTQHGMLGQTPTGEVLTSVAEQLQQQGYKIGIISSASLDHATPASFYANVPSRLNYYDIALQLIRSDFDFFGGGGFKAGAGSKSQNQMLLQAAESRGYRIADTEEDIRALDENAGKTIAINPVLNESEASFQYEIDRTDDGLRLSDFVQKGLDVLGDEQGFFMMCEGGLIDWAAHRNDAATLLAEMQELEDAIAVALEFYEKHPEDTLILVTGDHETGGLSIGSNLHSYDTYLAILGQQNISCETLASEFAVWRDEGTPFETALEYVSEHFGLCFEKNCASSGNGLLCASDYETDLLRSAYEESLVLPEIRDLEMDELYNMKYSSDAYYDPFSMTVTRVLDSRAGVGWTSSMHTGIVVPIYAIGAGAERFAGLIDNTDICKEILGLCIKKSKNNRRY